MKIRSKNPMYYQVLLILLLFVNLQFRAIALDVQTFDSANEAFQDGFYDVVVSKLEDLKYQKSLKNRVLQKAFLLLAYAYFYQDQVAQAEVLLDQLIMETDILIDRADILILKMKVLLKKNNYYLAEKTLNIIWEEDFSDKKKNAAFDILISKYFEKHKYDLAEDFLSALLSEDISSQNKLKVKLKLMECLLLSSKLKKAGSLLKEINLLTKIDSNLKGEAALLEGRLYLSGKHFDKGMRQYLKLYKKFDALSPAKQEALFGLALSYWNLKMFKEANASLFDYVERFPLAFNIGTANILLAESYVKLKDYQHAVIILKELTENYVDSEIYYKSLYWLGEAYYRTGKYEDALLIFEKLIVFQDQGESNYIYGVFGKAWVFYDQAEFNKAYELFIILTKLEFKHDFIIDAWIMAGNSQFLLKDYTKAKDIYSSFLKEYHLNLKIPEVLYKLGVVEKKLNNENGSIKIWDDLAKKYPDDSFAEDALWQSGTTLNELGLFDQAFLRFQKITKHFQDGKRFPFAMLEMGTCFYNQCKYEAAKQAYKLCADKVESKVIKHRATYCLGWCYYLLRDEQKAVYIFEQFLTNYPESNLAPQVLFWLGEYEFNRENFVRSLKFFEKLKDQYHDSDLLDNSYFLAGKSAFKLGLFDKTISLLSMLITGYYDSDLLADAFFLRGESYLKSGLIKEAIDDFIVFDTAFENSYLKNQAFEYLGDLFCQKKELINAIIYFNKSVKDEEAGDNKARVLKKLADSYKINGETNKAIATSLKLIYDDNSKEVRNKAIDFCIELYLENHDYKNAINLLMKLLDGDFDVDKVTIKYKIRKLRYFETQRKGAL